MFESNNIERGYAPPRTPEELSQAIGSAMKKKGRVRGTTIKNDIRLALVKCAGADAPKKIEGVLKDAGLDFSFGSFDSYRWYSHGFSESVYLASLFAFNWNLENIFELGRASTKGSILKNVILRFVSMRQTFEAGPGVWKKYFDYGEWVPVSFSEADRSIVFQIRNYETSVENEYFNAGYFTSIAELSTGSSEVAFSIIRSTILGDEVSEYRITW